MLEKPIFVGRGQELRRLAVCLDRTLNGRGQVCVLTGEPGAGKTTLALEFARLAQAARPDVIVASAACLPYYGATIPFYPFRVLLQILAGVGPARSLAEGQAGRLRRLSEHATATVLDWGRDLFQVFLSSQPESHAEEPREAEPLPTTLLFQQYANVLHRLSQKTPLVLLVDDLQWADRSSLALLEYLLPRLESSRVLWLLTHSPDSLPAPGEAAATASGLLARCCAEAVHLGQGADRAWVDALVEALPNRFDVPFREGLYGQTAGNALATRALLQLLRADGFLGEDEFGAWVMRRPIAWRRWPSTAADAAQALLDRLPPSVQHLLHVASLQGQVFVAEAAAQVVGQDVDEVLSTLSHPQVQAYGLIKPLRHPRVNGRKLHHFAFAHPLYLHLLYEAAPILQRAQLHAQTAAALQALLGPASRGIEHQAALAWHWLNSTEPATARPWLEALGKQAVAWSAWSEADRALSQALLYTPTEDQRFPTLLCREIARRGAGDVEGRQADLQALSAAAVTPHQQVLARLRQAQAAAEAGDYSRAHKAAAAALEHLEAAAEAETLHRAAAQRWLGEALLGLGDAAAAAATLAAALQAAEKGNHPQLQADLLRSLGACYLRTGRWEESRSCYERALWLCHSVGDRVGEAASRHGRALALLHQGRIDAAHDAHTKALAFARRHGNQRAELFALLSLASLDIALGRWAEAAAESAAARGIAALIGEEGLAAHALALHSVALRYSPNNADAAVAQAQQALAAGQQLNDWSVQRAALLALADGLASSGQHLQALNAYWQALDAAQTAGDDELALFALTGLTELALAAGAEHLAAAHAEEIRRRLSMAPAVTLDTLARPALAAYRGLLGRDPIAAEALLQESYERLMRAAQRIVDDAMRTTYLTAVPAHRDLSVIVAGRASATISVADLPSIETTVGKAGAEEPWPIPAPAPTPTPPAPRPSLPWWRRWAQFSRRLSEAAAAVAALAVWLHAGPW